MIRARLHQNLKKYCFIYLVLTALPLLLLSSIFIRLAIAYDQAPIPQAILTLGGSSLRTKFTAQFAQKHPALDVWVSSGSPPQEACPRFRAAGISAKRVHLDYQAVDTLTNFTSLVDDFRRLGVRHVYLITSDFHMRRAKAIATLVLGSQGIAFTPIAIPTDQPPNPILSLYWTVVGHCSGY